MQPPDPAPDPAHVNAGGEAPAPLREAGARGGPSPVAGCASRERSRGRRALDPKLPGSRFGGESPRRWGRRTPQSEVRSSPGRAARPGRRPRWGGAPPIRSSPGLPVPAGRRRTRGGAAPIRSSPESSRAGGTPAYPGRGGPNPELPGVFPCRRDAGVPGAGRPPIRAPRVGQGSTGCPDSDFSALGGSRYRERFDEACGAAPGRRRLGGHGQGRGRGAGRNPAGVAAAGRELAEQGVEAVKGRSVVAAPGGFPVPGASGGLGRGDGVAGAPVLGQGPVVEPQRRPGAAQAPSVRHRPHLDARGGAQARRRCHRCATVPTSTPTVAPRRGAGAIPGSRPAGTRADAPRPGAPHVEGRDGVLLALRGHTSRCAPTRRSSRWRMGRTRTSSPFSVRNQRSASASPLQVRTVCSGESRPAGSLVRSTYGLAGAQHVRARRCAARMGSPVRST